MTDQEHTNGQARELTTAGAAAEYVELGLAPIPINREKHPTISGWTKNWPRTREQVLAPWKRNPNHNVAIVTGAPSGRIIAIDLDVHHAEHNGIEWAEAWQAKHGRLPKTWEQRTGSGGKQLFYRANREVTGFANEDLGVDVRGDGNCSIVPPSIHACGGQYRWLTAPWDMPAADADELVYALIDEVRADWEARLAAKKAAKAAARREGKKRGKRGSTAPTAPVVEGGRNSYLFGYGRSLLGRGMRPGEVEVLMRNENSTNCLPPLPEEELAPTIKSVCSKPVGKARPWDVAGELSVFALPEGRMPRLFDETSADVTELLMRLQEVREGLRFNKADYSLHVLAPCIPNTPFTEPHGLTEGESAALHAALQNAYGLRNKGAFNDGLVAYGALTSQQYDPLADLLETLPKVKFCEPEAQRRAGEPVQVSTDGGQTWEERASVAGGLFHDLLGAEQSTYVEEAERLMFRQLLARAKVAGCKADHMTILVGKQGTGKSTFTQLLALSEDYYAEGFNRFDTEDLKRIAGLLVVEIAELDGFNGRDKNRIKSILTQTTDNYRDSYGRRPLPHPRTACFFGTTNDGSFLNDETGARRFLVIECKRGEEQADPRLFDGTAESMVKQAWGETLALWDLMGADAFLRTLTLPAEARPEAAAVRQRFAEEDNVRMAVAEGLERIARRWIPTQSRPRVNVKRAMVEAGICEEGEFCKQPQWQTNRVAAVLNSLPDWQYLGEHVRCGSWGTSRAWEYAGEPAPYDPDGIPPIDDD